MSDRLYQGIVTGRQRVRSNDGTSWLLIHTKNNSRPLAIRNGSIWPPNGSIVSAQVSQGRYWDFVASREVSVDQSPPHPYELDKRMTGVSRLIVPVILDHLRWN